MSDAQKKLRFVCPTKAELAAWRDKMKMSRRKPVVVAVLKPGAIMTDGSIFAGLTPDGKQRIYAGPADLPLTIKFNDAVEVIEKLNKNKALGHDDWHIPSLENLRVLCKNQNKGALKGTFNSSDTPDFPWYWSSTERPGLPYAAYNLCFSDSTGLFLSSKDNVRLSCRPVRLVPVTAPAPG